MSIVRINSLKQSIWTDFLGRDYLKSGELEKHIRDGVTGVTTNPTIFRNAMAEGGIYDGDIFELTNKGKDSIDIYEELVRRDVSVAARLLYSVYSKSKSRDGYVSVEVDPAFAHRVDATVYQAAHLFNLIDSPNVMIKIPGTDAGIEAFRRVIFEGISVNVTLLFSVNQYTKVAHAYVKALQDRVKDGRPVDKIASVASFFVSRIDSVVDARLQEYINHCMGNVEPLLGKAAIANARVAYAKYYEIFHSPEFVALRSRGAQPQRLLWASTSTKNPEYDPLKYVKGLIARDTVNTLPPATLNAMIECKDPLNHELESYPLYEADEYFAQLQDWVDFKEITDDLLKEGIQAFSSSFDELMACLYLRIAQAKGKKHASGDTKS